MKKLFAFLCSLTLLCTSVPVLPVTETAVITANADEEGTYENLKYMKYADYVIISGVTDKETITEANIPAEIDGLPVTKIVEGAFYYCKNLTSVTIPESVTIIWRGAFSDCSSLTSVTIPESVTSIGGYAFANTPWLKAKQEENPLVIGNGILIDGTTCEGDVTIPESVTSIGYGAFKGCSSLTSVIIPESVTSIGDEAFYYCENLTSVIIPESVTSIGYGAFSRCSSLTSVTIPEGVTSIGEGAFSDCSSLTSVTIENPDCEIYDSRDTISNGYDENYVGYFNGTIYGYENSTAQAYAEKYHFQFQSLGSAPELTTETAWNEINPDLNRDAKIDAKDAALVLVFAAEYGAGNIKNFAEFMDKQYPNQVQSLDTATETAWNEINPDMNRDGKIDAKDAALVLVFAAEFGAGNVKSFQEFMDKQYPEG